MSDYEALRLVSNCTTPWRSLDAYTRRRDRADDHILDGTEMMMKCFNCKKEECDNCLDGKYSDKRAVRMKEVERIFLGYYQAGYSKSEICKVMQIASTTYIRYVQRFIKGKKTR